MVKWIRKMGDLPFAQVMEVYAGSNAAAAREQWPDLGEMEARYRAEMEFYQYLRHDFFTTEDSVYALWLETDRPVSAVRFEKWKDGFLLEGLETHPEFRGRGYATRLMTAALEQIEGKIYAHVARDNPASLRVHEKCGFRKGNDTALVDGSFDTRFLTLVRDCC